MSTSPNHIGAWKRDLISFVPGHAARAQVLWAPGANGGRLHEVSVSNTNTAAILGINVAWARVIAKIGAGDTVAITGQNTIARSAGTLDLTGGRLIGTELLALLDAPTVGNRGVMARTTTAAAASLVFASSTFAANENLAAGTRLALVGRAATLNLPAGVGFTASAFNLLSATNFPHMADRPDTNAVSDAATVLIAWMNSASAVTAGNSVDFHVAWGDN